MARVGDGRRQALDQFEPLSSSATSSPTVAKAAHRVLTHCGEARTSPSGALLAGSARASAGLAVAPRTGYSTGGDLAQGPGTARRGRWIGSETTHTRRFGRIDPLTAHPRHPGTSPGARHPGTSPAHVLPAPTKAGPGGRSWYRRSGNISTTWDWYDAEPASPAEWVPDRQRFCPAWYALRLSVVIRPGPADRRAGPMTPAANIRSDKKLSWR
jgi:hypothetical protein